jgi:hypothetical protein
MPALGVVPALLALALAPRSYAQELNYNTYLIGTRAAGMGGAFTAIADDPSAAFHNPAGLGLLLRSSTSANLSVIAIEGWVMEGGYGSITGPRDLEHDAIPSLPLFVGFGQKFGDRDAYGVRQHGIALSIVRPAQIRRTFEVSVIDEARRVADSLRIDYEEDVEWYGVSYGIRLEPGLAIGIGGWAALRDIVYTEEQFVAAGIIPAGASRTADRLLARQSEATVSAIDLVFRLGFLWQIDPQWRVGAMLQTGGISISSVASISSQLGRTGTGMPPVIEELRFVEQDDLDGDWPLPWQLNLGVAYAFTNDFRMAFDLAIYSPIGTESNPVETFGAERDPVTGEAPIPGQFIASEWRANMIANVAIGLDALIANIVPLQAGIFTDFSAAPSIDGPSPIFRPPQVHGIGASIAGGLHRGDFDVQVGAAGVLGLGTGLGTNPDPDAPADEAYLPRDVRRYSVYFFINGTERAASSLVREILGDIEGEPQTAEAAEEAEEERRDVAAEAIEEAADEAAEAETAAREAERAAETAERAVRGEPIEGLLPGWPPFFLRTPIEDIGRD